MSQAEILHIAQQAILITFKLAAPILLVSLTIGVTISLFQAVTSVQEMTLTFVPKLAGIAVVIVVSGGWMLQQLSTFSRELFNSIPRLIAG
ncbi:MAG TPA: flagellar biosynthesis protein FliQ [Acidimicrobiales bacterium]|nr:flagellar biosynthesis protein FliQ [Acidimicrobiales bacterium]